MTIRRPTQRPTTRASDFAHITNADLGNIISALGVAASHRQHRADDTQDEELRDEYTLEAAIYRELWRRLKAEEKLR